MANSNDEQLIVGLDIGTSKVVTIVGLAGPGGTLEIVGTGLHPSSGLKRVWWSTSSPRFIPFSGQLKKPS